MNKGVLTTYLRGNDEYGTYILCSSESEAIEICRKRNIGERIESRVTEVIPMKDFTVLSDTEFLRNLPEIIHQACFLSWVAVSAGHLSPCEVLGDDGVLHELIHLNANTYNTPLPLARAREQLKQLQLSAIGFFNHDNHCAAH